MLITRIGYDGHFRLSQREYMPTELVAGTTHQAVDIHGDGHLYPVTKTTWAICPDLLGACTDSLDYEVRSTYDRLGRAIHQAQTTLNGDWSVNRVEYNDHGQLGRVYLPVLRNDATLYTPGDIYLDYTYDRLSRLVEVRDTCGNHTRTAYVGQRIDQTDAVGNTTTYHYNTLGQLVRVKDAAAKEWTYGYGPFGLLERLEDPLGNAFVIHHDRWGRIKGKEDPSATGFYNYNHNGFDQLTMVEDPQFVRTSFEYDRLGRLTIRRDPGAVLKYQYDDTVRRARGKLWSVKTPSNEKRYTYNTQGLLAEVTNRLEGEIYTDSFVYDAFGRLTEHEFPWGHLFQMVM